MTFLNVSLIGVGLIFIASSLDNSSLRDTFLKIVNGETINWSGDNSIPGVKSKSIQDTPQQGGPSQNNPGGQGPLA